MIIDQTGSLAGTKRHDYLPFGEELFAGTGARTPQLGYSIGDGVRQQFTLKERDSETGLDYFLARYYSSVQGRFTSPDPTLLSVAGHNPQTWNRYSYVMNNPLAYVDPLGLWALHFETTYKKDGDGNEILDKKGRRIVDRVTVTAVKTQDDDDAASLASQLGLKGGDAKDFIKKVGSGNDIQLSKTGGEVGRIFGIVESLSTEQAKHEAQGKKNGPSVLTYLDCSSTATSIAYGRDGGTFGVGNADLLIQAKGLKSISADDLSLGDIVRYATSGSKGTSNVAAHFTTFIFRSDSGVPMVFSRSGEGGPFQHGPASTFQSDKYGTIRGIGKDPTGFYRH